MRKRVKNSDAFWKNDKFRLYILFCWKNNEKNIQFFFIPIASGIDFRGKIIFDNLTMMHSTCGNFINKFFRETKRSLFF